MSQYRRWYQPGGWYFFTVVTADRARRLVGADAITRLRESFRIVRAQWPYEMDAAVILPDHLHCIWRLPSDDADFSTRWRLIKGHFARGVQAVANPRGEKRVWQRRFWEHLLRDEEDWRRHMDYIHYNPVKHGYVASAGAWPHSSFRHAVAQGYYDADWGRAEPLTIAGMKCE